jgi:uncharacterized delta-60 repeat protein
VRVPTAILTIGTAICCISAAVASAPAASSNVVVSLDVASSTTLDVDECAPGVADRTDFGTILPGTTSITGEDCEVVFGSSNDTARLELTQRDRSGVAMYSPYTDGRLDSDFATAGVATWGIVDEFVHAVYVDASGGTIAIGNGKTGTHRGAVWRFLDDGTLDPAFGTSAGVTYIDGTPNSNDPGFDGVLERDGTITAVGYGYANATTAHAYLARLDSDGQFITTFDGDGIAEFFIGSYVTFHTVAPHPDGGWVAGGYRKESGDHRLVVARILADGTLDSSFGSGGAFELERGLTGGGFQYEAIEDLAVLDDGRIIATGQVGSATNSTRWITVGITANGTLDTAGWNAPTGYWESTQQTSHGGWDIVQQDDGKVIVVGALRVSGDTRFTAIRHLTDGTFDPGFGGGDGIADTGFGGAGYEVASAVELLHDGSIMLGGRLDGLAAGQPVQVGLVRLTPAGLPDPTFGSSGKVASPAGAGNEDVRAMSLGTDGKLLLAGSDGSSARVTRFDAESIPSYESGTSDWAPAGPSHLGICLRDVLGVGVAPGAGWLEDPDNDCTAADTDPWREVARTEADATATVATTSVSGTTGATARFRFGIEVAQAQPPGSYIAPITFAVIAPAI